MAQPGASSANQEPPDPITALMITHSKDIGAVLDGYSSSAKLELPSLDEDRDGTDSAALAGSAIKCLGEPPTIDEAPLHDDRNTFYEIYTGPSAKAKLVVEKADDHPASPDALKARIVAMNVYKTLPDNIQTILDKQAAGRTLSQAALRS